MPPSLPAQAQTLSVSWGLLDSPGIVPAQGTLKAPSLIHSTNTI